jgi:hypothetical protein
MAFTPYNPNTPTSSDGFSPYTSASDVIMQKSLGQKASEVGSAIIQPVERLGLGIKNVAEGAGAMLGHALGGKDVTVAQPTSTDIFGNQVNALGYKDGQALHGGALAKDIAGNVAQNAALMVPAGELGAGASALTKIGQGIKVGATTGALQGAGSALQNQEDLSGVVGSAAQGAAVGGVLGGVVPAAVSGVSKGADYVGNIVNKDVATLRAEKIAQGLTEQNSKLKTAQKAFDNNTITRTMDGTKQTITPIDTIGKYNLTPEVKNGSLLTGHNITQIDDHLDNLDTTITDSLKGTGKTISIDELKAEAKKAAENNPILREAGKVKSTLAQVNNRIEDFAASYGDNIPIETVNKIRIRANRDFSPDTADASLVLGDVGRSIVHNATGDNSVKKLLQEQGNLLAAKKYLNTINGTKVSHGSIGKYALRTIGAVIGSTVEKAPVVGPLAGAFGGEAVARGLQQAQFKSAGVETKALLQKAFSKNPRGMINFGEWLPKLESDLSFAQKEGATTKQKLDFAKSVAKTMSDGGMDVGPVTSKNVDKILNTANEAASEIRAKVKNTPATQMLKSRVGN